MIPQSRWDGIGEDKLRLYVADGVRLCFELLIGKSDKKVLVNKSKLLLDFEKWIEEFLIFNL
jgi:hypothetical protein